MDLTAAGARDADWRPTADLTVVRTRAAIIARVRAYLAAGGVMEVDTPALSTAGATDPAIHSFTIPAAPGDSRRILHSSPEFPMKRLLAAGSGSIYQICKVFRDRERGPLHNPEFTLLEWYRVGFDHRLLMADVEALVRRAVGDLRCLSAACRVSYAHAFRQAVGIDPHAASLAELRATAHRYGIGFDELERDRDVWLDLLLSHVVQGHLPPFCFLYDYPASQAALARIREGSPPVAERFELFLYGIEVANGYHELGDAAEQRARFERDRGERRRRGLPEVPYDERLLAALEHGLPRCAGVALGVDRLVLAVLGLDSLAQTLAFPAERA